MTESAASTLGRLADCVLELGPVPEACPLGLAPTASTSAMLALGDALAMVVLEERGFSREDYARFHPAGSLGRRLLKVEEIMRRGAELPLAPVDATLEDQRLAGIFTDGDLRRLIEHAEHISKHASIADHMGRHPRQCRPDQLVEEAKLLLKGPPSVDQLVVVDQHDHPVGLLDIQDVLDVHA
jgi:arabinose-5-phosphate isomerase